MGLCHTRLAIIDTRQIAMQPMTSHDGRFTIVFNGEIYNYQELRRGLEQSGFVFRTTSDTEVLLELFAREGTACLKRLQGMFAFGVWDSQSQAMYLARDPLGVKPLYFWQSREQLGFASEVNALIELRLSEIRCVQSLWPDTSCMAASKSRKRSSAAWRRCLPPLAQVARGTS